MKIVGISSIDTRTFLLELLTILRLFELLFSDLIVDPREHISHTQKIKFSIKEFFSRCDYFLRIL